MILFRWLLFLFILLTIEKSNHASFSTECNPIYCLSILDSLFDADGEDSCLKATTLINCASSCFSSASENVMIKALKVMEDDLCSKFYQDDSINVNKCWSKQKYALFSCFYKFFNSEADDPLVDPKFLNCRISLNIGMCERLSSPCTSRASYISETLLRNFFNSFLTECSGIDEEDLQNVYLKSSHFKEYGLLAECLDKNSILVTQCFSQAVADLPLTSKNVCRMNAATQCIEHIVLNNCDSYLHVFKNISQSLTDHTTPICSNTDLIESLEYKKGEIPSLASTLMTKKFSDLPETEKVTESIKLAAFPTVISSDTPKDLIISRNDSKFHTTHEINSDFLQRVLHNITTLTNNTTNSTPPIIIHKHVVMTVSYRAKSDASSFSVFFTLITALCLIQYLGAGILI